jgi:hypothetical protein
VQDEKVMFLNAKHSYRAFIAMFYVNKYSELAVTNIPDTMTTIASNSLSKLRGSSRKVPYFGRFSFRKNVTVGGYPFYSVNNCYVQVLGKY